MMMRAVVLLGVLMATSGCFSSGTSNPSSCGEPHSVFAPYCCQDAIAHYYAAGCTYSHGGVALSQSDATGTCDRVQTSTFSGVQQNAPGCQGRFAIWIDCNNSGSCNCQLELDDLLAGCDH